MCMRTYVCVLRDVCESKELRADSLFGLVKLLLGGVSLSLSLILFTSHSDM